MAIPFNPKRHRIISSPFSRWLRRATGDCDVGVYQHRKFGSSVVFAWSPHARACGRKMHELVVLDPSDGDVLDAAFAHRARFIVLSRRRPTAPGAKHWLEQQESKLRQEMREHEDDTRETRSVLKSVRRNIHNQVRRDVPVLFAVG